MSNLDKNNQMAPAARSGKYNDPDMLVCGQQGISIIECKSHFFAWAIVAAPILISFDITDKEVDPEVVAVVAAPEVLSVVSQDPGHVQGVRVSAPNPFGGECWAKPLSPADDSFYEATTSVAALLLNRANITSSTSSTTSSSSTITITTTLPTLETKLSNITCTWQELGLPTGKAAHVRDLFAQKDLGIFTDSFSAMLAPHDSMIVSVTLV